MTLAGRRTMRNRAAPHENAGRGLKREGCPASDLAHGAAPQRMRGAD